MKRVNHKIHWLKKTLGPGILFASTAIGVSHLVQSTRAGAKYGFGLLILSTSKGVLSGRDARLKNVGGEVIGEVY